LRLNHGDCADNSFPLTPALLRNRLLLGVPPSGGTAFSRLKPGLRTSSGGSRAQGAQKVRGILSLWEREDDGSVWVQAGRVRRRNGSGRFRRGTDELPLPKGEGGVRGNGA
jgi:hypothetical protein